MQEETSFKQKTWQYKTANKDPEMARGEHSYKQMEQQPRKLTNNRFTLLCEEESDEEKYLEIENENQAFYKDIQVLFFIYGTPPSLSMLLHHMRKQPILIWNDMHLIVGVDRFSFLWISRERSSGILNINNF